MSRCVLYKCDTNSNNSSVDLGSITKSVMAEYMREQRCSLGVIHRTVVRPLQVREETEDGSDNNNLDSGNDFAVKGR